MRRSAFGVQRCCDVAYLYQAFSQHTGPGRLWISLSTILLPDILSSRWTEPNNELNSYSVTDVLTHKCYRCPDCAAERRSPNAEHFILT